MARNPGVREKNIAKRDTLLRNKVHELVEYIESSFRKDGFPRRNFSQAALASALEFLNRIIETEGVSTAAKVELLSQIAKNAAELAEQLSATTRVAPNAFWAERGKDKRYMSPCDFVKLHWPTYGNGLVLSDIRAVDKPLYRALIYFKREHGWAEDFVLPTKSQYNDQLLRQLSTPVHLNNLDDLPAEARRQRRRLERAQRYRAGKKPPAR